MKLIIENFGTVEVPIKIGDIVRIKKDRYGAIFYWRYVKKLPKLLKVCPYQYGEGNSLFYTENGCVKEYVPKEWKIKHVFLETVAISYLSLIVVLVSRFKDTLAISYNMNHSNGVWEEYNSPFEVINRDRKGLEEIKVERV
jgi:hypothetical protein